MLAKVNVCFETGGGFVWRVSAVVHIENQEWLLVEGGNPTGTPVL